MNIDRTKPVLVTGATGYVGGWVVKKLLEEGLTVHVPTRNPQAKDKLRHLDALAAASPGSIRYFQADLIKPGAYAEAMRGCELVFHMASPVFFTAKDPQKELIDPALEGTRNVLQQANDTPSVKRVVLTSSIAAIYCDSKDCAQAPNGTLTEDIWNTTSSLTYLPYSYSKTLAEREAWKIAEAQSRWDLIAINPSPTFGPALNTSTNVSVSVKMIQQLGDGSCKGGAPDFGVGVVDVRDVAEAHYRAAFTPSAKGRYITCGHNTTFLEMARVLYPNYSKDFPVPNKAAPKLVLQLFGSFVDPVMTWRWVRDNVGHPWRADSSRIRKELGMEFRALEPTLRETFQDLTASAAHLSLGISDPDDAWIVAEAMAGEADALVTGDAARRRARTIGRSGALGA